MKRIISSNQVWMVAIVLVHLVVTIIHGVAHTNAHVPLSPAASAFVFSVILAGPLIGLALMLFTERIGSGVVALTMAGAFIFGSVNHFIFASPDHVAHVDPLSRTMFATTAVLLAFTEAVALGLAVSSARVRRSL